MSSKEQMQMLMKRLEVARSTAPRSLLTQNSWASGLYSSGVNTENTFSEIWRVYMPLGRVTWFDSERAFRLLLGFVETVASAGGAGSEAFETTHAPARILDSSGDHVDGIYQRVYAKDDATVAPVTACADHVDGGTASITATIAGDEDFQVCYVPYFDGKLTVRVESPKGDDALAAVVLSTDILGLHSDNQMLINRTGWSGPLPADYSIAIYLESAYQIAWANGCTANASNLPFTKVQFPIRTAPDHHFFVKGEKYPGSTLRAIADNYIQRG